MSRGFQSAGSQLNLVDFITYNVILLELKERGNGKRTWGFHKGKVTISLCETM